MLSARGIAGRAAIFLALSVGVTVLLLGLAGKFAPKISMQKNAVASDDNVLGPVAEVRLVRLPLLESAVGTVRPVNVTTIGARLLARVVEVNLKAGQVVKPGDVLARLDDVDLRARLHQAEAVLNAAEAARGQAEADANRAAALVRSNAVSQQDNERAGTALKAADAELSRARESLNEIRATIDWATIRSPIQGIVIDKKVDAGDMVSPGQMLATLFDPKRMQLVATVRESLARHLKVGQPIEVEVENFNMLSTGTISEIVPEAESNSRTFQVKVTGPCPEGIYSGMFGRILIPLGDEQILVIPRQAVQRIGQLELVNVATDGAVSRRAIRLGRTVGEDVEVLSGLREGELVQVHVNTAAARGATHG
jgi:RND family efflux transporter MFP subunit